MEEMVIFDLEYTTWEGAMERDWDEPNEHREVVQIGALKVDSKTLNEVDSLSVFVKPKINPELSEFFINLTGITQKQVDAEGVSFEEALGQFHLFVDSHTIYSWGADSEVLKENCNLYTIPFPFKEEQFFDMRNIFQKQGIDSNAYMSSTIPNAFGIENPHQGHNALNDARSILLALKQLPENPF